MSTTEEQYYVLHFSEKDIDKETFIVYSGKCLSRKAVQS
jgi:hypothetical protein